MYFTQICVNEKNKETKNKEIKTALIYNTNKSNLVKLKAWLITCISKLNNINYVTLNGD